jgi:hypothetical protein
MASQKGKGIVVIATIAVLGALTYIGITLFGSKEDKDTGGKDTGGGDTGGGDTGGGGNAVSGLTTPEQVALATAYRLWANSTEELNKKYGKKSQFDLDATSPNPYNSFFLKSYALGKSDYEASLKKPTGSSAYSIPQDIQNDILTIVAMGTGAKAKKIYLENEIEKRSKRDWIRQWASALRANKADREKGTTFNWVSEGKDFGLYESFSGNRILAFNPANRNPAPLAKAYWYGKPEVSSWSYVQATGDKIGKVTGYKWINSTKKLWLYVAKPNDSAVSDANIFGTRWIQADEVKF